MELARGRASARRARAAANSAMRIGDLIGAPRNMIPLRAKRDKRERDRVVPREERESRRRLSQDRHDLCKVARRFLDPHDRRHLPRQGEDRGRLNVRGGPRRHVVQHDWQTGNAVAHGLEVGEEPRLRGLVVVGRHDEHAVDPSGADGLRPLDGHGRRIRADPGEHLRPPVRSLDHDADHPRMLVGRQGQGLAGRPARDQETHAARDLALHERAHPALVDCAVGP